MERTMGFNSTTGAVKALVMEFVEASDKPVERKELVAYINEKMGYNDRLTDGVIAGAIKILINNGELVTVRRGCYEKGSGKTKSSAFEKIYGICERFSVDLDRACTVNIMDLTDKERAVYPDFFNALVTGKGSVELMVGDLKALMDSIRDEAVAEDVEPITDDEVAFEPEVEQVVEPVQEEMMESADEVGQEPEMVEAETPVEGEVDTEVPVEKEVESVEATAEEAVVETPATEEVEAVEPVEISEAETVADETEQPVVEEVAPVTEETASEEIPATEDETAVVENTEDGLSDTVEPTADTEAVVEEAADGKKNSRKRNRKNR